MNGFNENYCTFINDSKNNIYCLKMFQLLFSVNIFFNFFKKISKSAEFQIRKQFFSPISQFFAISQLRPSRKSNCVVLRLRLALKKLNCVICEIVFFSQSQFAISQSSQFSQSILQPWYRRLRNRGNNGVIIHDVIINDVTLRGEIAL